MKSIMLVAIMTISLVGCATTPYNTVKIGPDRYSVTGSDPNQLQGNAYRACKEDGFDDYAVVENTKRGIVVRCESTPKSITTQVGEAWDSVKKRVDDFRKEQAKKEEVGNNSTK